MSALFIVECIHVKVLRIAYQTEKLHIVTMNGFTLAPVSRQAYTRLTPGSLWPKGDPSLARVSISSAILSYKTVCIPKDKVISARTSDSSLDLVQLTQQLSDTHVVVASPACCAVVPVLPEM